MQGDELTELCAMVWGHALSEEIFQRWSQGFSWSSGEKCALIQHFGGPCAVIVPIQAYFLKRLLFHPTEFQDNLPVLSNIDTRRLSDSTRKRIFVETLYEILLLMNTESWYLCLPTRSSRSERSDSSPLNQREERISFGQFHSNIKFLKCQGRQELFEKLQLNLQHFTADFGVIRFLYSIIMSKSIRTVLNEVDSHEVTLIDQTHGHGSQNLINLFLCGHAVSNVFDGERNIGGLRLNGIPNSCSIGFLTLLERLRYCTVGDALKRPKYPIWVIASETHLTIFFSLERSLVAPDAPLEIAQKIFDRYDPEDNGFIPATLLKDVLSEMNLVSEPEYVEVMNANLDPENLGVIIRSKFFEEFFADEKESSIPESFEIFHYNGLAQSSHDNNVRFRKGVARQMDWQENSEKAADSVIESCLQLRWPGLWITWEDGQAPSLN